MKNKIATTIKLDDTLYDEFKILGIRHKVTLQALIERTVYKYVTDENYREQINNFFMPVSYDFGDTQSSIQNNKSLPTDIPSIFTKK